ncbi:MAG TPA: phosphonopyruvate decarboxylase [Candidatus Saccharimonadales bacterium]|nr:phosphonopyruvate decarboxylase [Candidatus Saccharimonadales bacterium]
MKVAELTDLLIKEELTFLTGVPCSYLKELLGTLDGRTDLQHVAASSEGEAVGIAAGYHLATGRVPVIYLQNSGLGNAINPLTSLSDREVYGIPGILFLTWRGEPGKPDEPQHKKMGRIMPDLLEDLEINYGFADRDIVKTTETVRRLKAESLSAKKPVALIFRPKLIEKTEATPGILNAKFMKREKILKLLLPKIGESPLVTTTGKTSREVFELREKNGQSHQQDFLTVGSMGCAAGIGLGIARQTSKRVFVIDGDGAVLMKMGTLATIGHYNPENLIHIVIDNGAYESTGSQPTVAKNLKWRKLFNGFGYKTVLIIRTQDALKSLELEKIKGPAAVVVYSRSGSRPDLGRPTTGPGYNKRQFMNFLGVSDE